MKFLETHVRFRLSEKTEMEWSQFHCGVIAIEAGRQAGSGSKQPTSSSLTYYLRAIILEIDDLILSLSYIIFFVVTITKKQFYGNSY